jgi:predicted transcriptional regulator of viral defense system
MKYIDFVRQTFNNRGFPVFTIRDLKIGLSERRISAGYLYTLVHELLRKKEITRITRGIYTFHNDVFVVGFAFEPFYYGLECALSMRGLSTQGTNPIVITTRNVRAGVRTFNGRNYRIQKINGNLLFGYELLKYGEFWVPVSDVEKTVIDLVYFGYGIRDELLNDIHKHINMKKLNEYLKKYDTRFKKKVFAELKVKETQKVLA